MGVGSRHGYRSHHRRPPGARRGGRGYLLLLRFRLYPHPPRVLLLPACDVLGEVARLEQRADLELDDFGDSVTPEVRERDERLRSELEGRS